MSNKLCRISPIHLISYELFPVDHIMFCIQHLFVQQRVHIKLFAVEFFSDITVSLCINV